MQSMREVLTRKGGGGEVQNGATALWAMGNMGGCKPVVCPDLVRSPAILLLPHDSRRPISHRRCTARLSGFALQDFHAASRIGSRGRMRRMALIPSHFAQQAP